MYNGREIFHPSARQEKKLLPECPSTNANHPGTGEIATLKIHSPLQLASEYPYHRSSPVNQFR